MDIQFLINSLKALLAYYEKASDQAAQNLKNAPEGRLKSIMCHNKVPQYYWVKKEWKDHFPNGKYLSIADKPLAKTLAEKEYNNHLLQFLNTQTNALQSFLDNFHPAKIQDIYESLAPAKKLLVTPIEPTDEDFIKTWYGDYHGSQNSYEFPETFTTEKGEKVRSKSEMLIANKLFYLNIPYKYEVPLKLGDGTVYPDFTILNVRTRETKYLEHLGQLDNSDYCKKNLPKIDRYIHYGYIPGQNLIITMESSLKPMDFNSFNKLITIHFL